MKLSHKLILGFVVVSLLSALTGYFSLKHSKAMLQDAFVERSEFMSARILDGLEREILHKIEMFQEYTSDSLLHEELRKANRQFERLKNTQSFINRKDNEWIEAPTDEVTPFMQTLMSNGLAEALKSKLNFYRRKYGYEVFSEIFITNRFGANVAQTGKTSDYRQDDEEWWQQAREEGLHVGDVAYDRSSNVYAIDIAFSISDSNNEFLGVMKAVLNVAGVIALIQDMEDTSLQSDYGRAHFKILTHQGRLIYSTSDGHDFLDDLSNLLPEELGEADIRFPRVRSIKGYGNQKGIAEIFLTHSRSRRLSDLGLNWILIVEEDRDELFVPVRQLRRQIVTVSVIVTIIGVLTGLTISTTILKRLRKLRNGARRVGRGNLDFIIKDHSYDEIGQLIRSFNKMTADLRSLTASRDELNREIEERRKAEVQIEEQKDVLQKNLLEIGELRDLEEERLADLNVANEQLRMAIDDAEAASRAKSQFFARVNQEIRIPTDYILNLTQAVLTADDHRDQRKHIAAVKESAQSIISVLNAIADILQVESGDLKLQKRKCDMQMIMEGIVLTLSPEARKKGLDLAYDVDRDVPSQLKGDDTRLKQVLITLAGNAIKHTTHGRVTLSVRTGRTTSGRKATDPGTTFIVLHFAVSDTGVGMAPDQLNSIFETFNNRDSSIFREYGETRLGLSISNKLVHIMGGEIWVESEEGRGTTFHFTSRFDLTSDRVTAGSLTP